MQTLYRTANVTQLTSITTDVTVDALNGVITTVSSTLAANTKTSFVVNNDLVTAASRILLSVQYDDLATGIPIASVDKIIAGKFNLVISNAAGVDALNNVVKVHYIILN